jgi:hypothetical protein
MTKKKPSQQKYQPKFIFWHELEFMGDEQVAMGMSNLQRHFYRALCIKGMFCSTRPYLPNDDNQLWLLADAGSLKVWQENKDAVLVKFQEVEIEGVKLLAHKRLLRDWELLLKDHKKRVKGGKNRWIKSKKTNSDHSEEDATEDAETGTDIDESAV